VWRWCTERLIVQLQQDGNPSLHPQVLRVVGGHTEPHDEVSRVASGRQSACCIPTVRSTSAHMCTMLLKIVLQDTEIEAAAVCLRGWACVHIPARSPQGAAWCTVQYQFAPTPSLTGLVDRAHVVGVHSLLRQAHGLQPQQWCCREQHLRSQKRTETANGEEWSGSAKASWQCSCHRFLQAVCCVLCAVGSVPCAARGQHHWQSPRFTEAGPRTHLRV
jgi:hypothetical protein